MTFPEHEHYKTLLMQAVDGRLEEADEEVWRGHLERCQECRDELSDFVATAAQMDAFRERTIHERSMRSQTLPMSGGGRVGVISIVAGYCLMWGFGVWKIFTAPDIPTPIRVGYGVVLIGLTIALFTVGRERLLALKSDPYSEVER